MNKAESRERQIDIRPPVMLYKVDWFIVGLRNKTARAKAQVYLLSYLVEHAVNDDLPADLAEQHTWSLSVWDSPKMRQTIFLDTSYLIALIWKKDVHHSDALAAASIFTGRLVTTDLVLVELVNSLSLPPTRAVVISAIERIRTDAVITIIPVTSEGMALDVIQEQAWQAMGFGWMLFFCGYERKTDMSGIDAWWSFSSSWIWNTPVGGVEMRKKHLTGNLVLYPRRIGGIK